MTEQDFHTLREGFHKLIKDAQESRLKEFVAELEEKRIGILEKRLQQLERHAGAAAGLQQRLAQLEARQELSPGTLSQLKAQQTKELHAVQQQVGSLAHRIAAVKALEQQLEAGVLDKLAQRVSVLEGQGTLERVERAAARDRKKAAAVEERVAEAEKASSRLPELAEQVASLRKKVAAAETFPEHLVARIDALEKELRYVPKNYQQPLQALHKKLLALQQRTDALADAADVERKFREARKDVQETRELLVKKLSLVEALPRLPAAVNEKLEFLEREVAGLEEVRPQLERVARQVLELEKATDQVRERTVKDRSGKEELTMRLARLEKEVGMLKAPALAPEVLRRLTAQDSRLNQLEAGQKDLPQLVAPRLRELEGRLREPLADQKGALKDLERSLDALARRVDGLAGSASGLEDQLAPLGKQVEAVRGELKNRVERADIALLQQRMNKLDALLQEKLSSKMIHTLQGLEDEIEEKMRAHQKIFSGMQNELSRLKGESATRRDLDALEQQLLRPLEGLEGKITDAAKRAVAAVEGSLRKSMALEKIDVKTLQKEIDRIVSEMEKQRTQSLEAELAGILKESEKVKRVV
ncbi:MAG: hypothetical protein HY520_00400 [Candidatus Aenigmarchaeota archaeon]|nr:hypothetical protein [Candidatus Aenigmarchaeota archaeon]